jgi:hypothetical protein
MNFGRAAAGFGHKRYLLRSGAPIRASEPGEGSGLRGPDILGSPSAPLNLSRRRRACWRLREATVALAGIGSESGIAEIPAYPRLS